MDNEQLPVCDFKERLYQGMAIRGYKQADLVDRTGIDKGSISHYFTGYAKPKQDRIYLIAKALNVDEGWLLGFDVPMERQNPYDRMIGLEKDESSLLGKYQALTPEQKEAIHTVIDTFLKGNN